MEGASLEVTCSSGPDSSWSMACVRRRAWAQSRDSLWQEPEPESCGPESLHQGQRAGDSQTPSAEAGGVPNSKITSWLSECRTPLRASLDDQSASSSRGALKNGCSFEDDLSLGAEANHLQSGLSKPESQPGLRVDQKRTQFKERGRSMNSTGSGKSSTVSSVSELLDLYEEDPEEILYNLGFGREEPDLASKVPSRFFNSMSSARGIDIKVYLGAQLQRMELENPNYALTNRFRQIEVLTSVANEFFQLYSQVSGQTIQPISSRDKAEGGGVRGGGGAGGAGGAEESCPPLKRSSSALNAAKLLKKSITKHNLLGGATESPELQPPSTEHVQPHNGHAHSKHVHADGHTEQGDASTKPDHQGERANQKNIRKKDSCCLATVTEETNGEGETDRPTDDSRLEAANAEPQPASADLHPANQRAEDRVLVIREEEKSMSSTTEKAPPTLAPPQLAQLRSENTDSFDMDEVQSNEDEPPARTSRTTDLLRTVSQQSDSSGFAEDPSTDSNSNLKVQESSDSCDSETTVTSHPSHDVATPLAFHQPAFVLQLSKDEGGGAGGAAEADGRNGTQEEEHDGSSEQIPQYLAHQVPKNRPMEAKQKENQDEKWVERNGTDLEPEHSPSHFATESLPQHTQIQSTTEPPHTQIQSTTEPSHTQIQSTTEPPHTQVQSTTEPPHTQIQSTTEPSHTQVQSTTEPVHTQVATEPVHTQFATEPEHTQVQSTTEPVHTQIQSTTASEHSQIQYDSATDPDLSTEGVAICETVSSPVSVLLDTTSPVCPPALSSLVLSALNRAKQNQLSRAKEWVNSQPEKAAQTLEPGRSRVALQRSSSLPSFLSPSRVVSSVRIQFGRGQASCTPPTYSYKHSQEARQNEEEEEQELEGQNNCLSTLIINPSANQPPAPPTEAPPLARPKPIPRDLMRSAYSLQSPSPPPECSPVGQAHSWSTQSVPELSSSQQNLGQLHQITRTSQTQTRNSGQIMFSHNNPIANPSPCLTPSPNPFTLNPLQYPSPLHLCSSLPNLLYPTLSHHSSLSSIHHPAAPTIPQFSSLSNLHQPTSTAPQHASLGNLHHHHHTGTPMMHHLYHSTPPDSPFVSPYLAYPGLTPAHLSYTTTATHCPPLAPENPLYPGLSASAPPPSGPGLLPSFTPAAGLGHPGFAAASPAAPGFLPVLPPAAAAGQRFHPEMSVPAQTPGPALTPVSGHRSYHGLAQGPSSTEMQLRRVLHDIRRTVQSLNQSQADTANLFPEHRAAPPNQQSLMEFQQKRQSLNLFRNQMMDLELSIIQQQAQIYRHLSPADRLEVEQLQSLRSAVREELQELEQQLEDRLMELTQHTHHRGFHGDSSFDSLSTVSALRAMEPMSDLIREQLFLQSELSDDGHAPSTCCSSQSSSPVRGGGGEHKQGVYRTSVNITPVPPPRQNTHTKEEEEEEEQEEEEGSMDRTPGGGGGVRMENLQQLIREIKESVAQEVRQEVYSELLAAVMQQRPPSARRQLPHSHSNAEL